MRGVLRLYALLLRLYPRSFRTKFGAEMQAVFRETLAGQTWLGQLCFCGRELRDFPGALWHAYLRDPKGANMNPNFKKPTWFFYLGWIVLSAFAVILALGLTSLILKVITEQTGSYITVNGTRHIAEDYLFGFIFVPLLCLLTSFLQALLLRPYFPKSLGGWVGMTALGWLAVVLSIQLTGGVIFNLELILGFAWVGTFIGFFQWLWLRRHLPQAGWWIFASLLGWTLVAVGTYTPIRNGSLLAQLLPVGIFPALATGVAWWFLLKHKATPEDKVSA